MKELTIIIPFKNEGSQVYKTCESLNRHCNPATFDILCLNDCSDDHYDYSEITRFDNVTLLENPKRLGVAGSRDKGVKICSTPYVLLIDGHMRVFNDIVTPLLEKLHLYPDTLLCCQSRIIRFNSIKQTYELERRPQTKGVSLNSRQLDANFLSYSWQTLSATDQLLDVIPIQCCMGACYAISRQYYLHLHGLNGLQQWGMDEQFLSAKVWMSGSNVLLLKNIEIAHIYRTGTPIPYQSFSGAKLLNLFIVVYLLADRQTFITLRENIKNDPVYLMAKDTIDIFDDLLPFLEKERTYLSLITKHPFTHFLNLANYGKL